MYSFSATYLSPSFIGEGTGGNSLTTKLNLQFAPADMVWMGISSALVWIMIPGIGLLYSGLSRKKHALSLLWASIMAACLTALQWFFWGYSLVFTHTSGSPFLGSLLNFCLMKVLGAPSIVSTVPDILFVLFQGIFAAVTAILMVGAGCERARLGPMMLFLFVWLTVVYIPVAYWIWGKNGCLVTLGCLDFAGGEPVHENFGFAALAYSLLLGKRHDPLITKKVPKFKPHSVTSIGFLHGGSTGNASIRSWYACFDTDLAAAAGGLTWMFVDWFRTGGKWSTVGLCTGSIAGLVGITPAAPILCNFAVDLKNIFMIDDGMDVFALHGVGGFAGSVLTGIFAADFIAATEGVRLITGGWMNKHWKQLGFQLANSVSIVTFLKLRLHENEELLGVDLAEIGEYAYYDEDYSDALGKNPKVMRMREAAKEKKAAKTKREPPIEENESNESGCDK
ncbi:Rh-like protein/ammonium transporter [Metschnikowia bicuspidata]|uniref:Rh-like protein/ammonium transporter n=1 Tax=Metschnikowia bicuspidata TaxID=27322 RepID=A0A4P9ZB85_9ASCO|nr:Rh-like protein/ammonium transporter [Metschnikowia bicuspidata]